MEIDLELARAVKAINDAKARTVLLQLPDGLKSKAGDIQERLEHDTKATAIIWAGSCYGACDIPRADGIDMLIQWGHSEWA
jgi:2-(3-amino-3-carboxypropyl)histidine synthase